MRTSIRPQSSFAIPLACLLALGLSLAAGRKPLAKPAKEEGAGAAAKIACAGAGSVTVAATDLKLKCDAGHKNCDGEIPVRAKNCSQDFLEVVQLEMYEADRRSFSIDYKPASVVPPHTAGPRRLRRLQRAPLKRSSVCRPSYAGRTSLDLALVNSSLADRRTCGRRLGV